MPKRVIDIYVVYQIIKRLATPFTDMEAYDLGLIDKNGNFQKKRREMTREEKRSLTQFDVMIVNIKRLLSKLPGGDSKLRNFATALWLLKEDIERNAAITASDVEILVENIEEEGEMKKPFKQFMSENIANSIGGGAIDNTDLKISNVGKCRVYDVSTKTFMNCRNAKKRYERFMKYVGDGPVSDDIRTYAKKNPGASIMLRDQQTGAHTFLKLGSKTKF